MVGRGLLRMRRAEFMVYPFQMVIMSLRSNFRYKDSLVHIVGLLMVWMKSGRKLEFGR
jgi:hypothetical protein